MANRIDCDRRGENRDEVPSGGKRGFEDFHLEFLGRYEMDDYFYYDYYCILCVTDCKHDDDDDDDDDIAKGFLWQTNQPTSSIGMVGGNAALP